MLLARIDDFVKGEPLAPEQIHGEVRREISLRPTTRVTGINWVQGGSYTPEQAGDLLGTGSSSGGLEIRFSRPIRTETVIDGVVDIWVVEGGRGRAAAISNKPGVLVLPQTPTTDRIVYRDDTAESVNYGDRVLVIVRTAFLLDECCRPVDGAHVGGRVPLLPDSPPASVTPERTVCLTPPGVAGPWTSGDGGAGQLRELVLDRERPVRGDETMSHASSSPSRSGCGCGGSSVRAGNVSGGKRGGCSCGGASSGGCSCGGGSGPAAPAGAAAGHVRARTSPGRASSPASS